MTAVSAKKWVAGLVVLLAVMSGSVYYFQMIKSKPVNGQETVAVTRGKIVSSVAATGTIKPVNEVDISSQISALIKEIKVKENDYVKAGQVLAVLDDTTYRTALDKAIYEMNNYAAKYQRIKYLNSIGAKSDSDLEDALLNYQTSVATYESDQSDLEKTVITSPIDGIVMGEPISVGTLVQAGVSDPKVIMMIGDVGQKMVKVKVDETDIGNVKVGQQATFTVDAYQNHTFQGSVTKIGQISTDTTSVSSTTSSTTSSTSSTSSSTSSVVYYYVTLAVDDPDGLLKPAMTARVNITVGEKDDVLLIPLAALKTSTNGQYVTVLHANGVAENVPVTVGLTNNDKVEVTNGLAEGDKLLISYTKSQSQSTSKQKDNGPPPM